MTIKELREKTINEVSAIKFQNKNAITFFLARELGVNHFDINSLNEYSCQILLKVCRKLQNMNEFDFSLVIRDYEQSLMNKKDLYLQMKGVYKSESKTDYREDNKDIIIEKSNNYGVVQPATDEIVTKPKSKKEKKKNDNSPLTFSLKDVLQEALKKKGK